MTNLDHDPLVAAFDEFRSRAAPLVKPAGVDRARESARIRGRNRTIAIAGLSALIVAIPLMAGNALAGRPRRSASDTPTAVPHVSASAPYFVGPGETTHPSDKAPKGGITEVALYSATLDLPAWPAATSKCVNGPVQFQAGDTFVAGSNLWIAGVSYADVDQDGRAETIARIFCLRGMDDPGSQVVASCYRPTVTTTRNNPTTERPSPSSSGADQIWRKAAPEADLIGNVRTSVEARRLGPMTQAAAAIRRARIRRPAGNKVPNEST
jgi:hypothetical protein